MNARTDHLLDDAQDLPVEERSALVTVLLDRLKGGKDSSIAELWNC